MNQQTKPSAGALRASKALHGNMHPPIETELVIRLGAELIDRESGLAEALDALRGMVGLVQLIQSTESPAQKHLVMSNHRFIEAMRVIDKAENPNSTATQPYPKGRYDTV